MFCLLRCFFVCLPVLAGLSLWAAPIPGLFNTGVGTNGVLLVNGAVDPHYRLVQSADTSAPGPNTFAVTDTLFPIVSGPWLASGPNSKWIAPQANQSSGNQAGDYQYRLAFDLTGLEPSSAVIRGRWTSDNGGPDVLLNGVSTGATSDGNFSVLGNPFTIGSGFIDGTNTLDFVVNNGAPGINPTGLRVELSGTADLQPPPGTPPAIVTQPASVTVGLLDPATFSVGVSGSRPFSYQWRMNGAPIPGAGSSSFTIANARAADAGGYDVIVTNLSGTVTSRVATLTVVFLSPAQLTYEPLGPSSRRTGLTFSEIMYHPAPNADGLRTEFIELNNSNPFFEDISGWRLTGDIDYTFPSNTVIQGNSFLVVAPAPADVQTVYGITGVLGGFQSNLPNDSGTIRLRKRSGAIVLEVHYSDQPPWPVAADGTGQSLVLARPSYGEGNPQAWAASARRGGSPGGPDPVPAGPLENIVINEILAHTDLPLVDFIELFNNSPLSVDLSGCWLSDDPTTNKFRIPDGTVLGAREFTAFQETQLGFALQADGETLYLVNSNQSRVLDAVRFGGQGKGAAFGRYPDGAPDFQPLRARTPGTTNAPPFVQDIVINEIMYNPISGDGDDQYVELYNRGANPVNLGGWRFSDGITFTFPPESTIPAGGYLVVAKNASRLLTNYPGLTTANVLGAFVGQLAHGGEHLALAAPETILSTNATTLTVTTNLFYVVVDEVSYVDGGHWGNWSDGGGSSLELIDAHSDNRAGANWADSDETAKAAWTVVETTGVLDLGSGTADRLQVLLLGQGEALVDDVEVLVSGVNRVPNPGFESGTTGWIFGGTHSKSGWETNSGYNSAHSLHLRASDRGDNAANRVSALLSAAVAPGSTATIRAKVRWLRGHPEILFRLKGNWLEAFGRLSVPPNLGSPGAPNSQARANTGPVFREVSHRPVLPQPNQSIRVTARVSDPDGVQSVILKYRLDPDTTLLSAPMVDDGTGGDALAGDGIFTGIIPGQPSGKLVAFHLEAIDGFVPGATARFPSDAPVRACLVRVGETEPAGAFGAYRLWLTAATVATWTGREKLSNENLDGTFVAGNHRVIYNVGAHYSGSPYTTPTYTSPVGALCGYDIIFPEDDSFLGSAHMVLDWPIRDDTDQREQLMFWFLEQYGLPNMYRRYVIMFVNGARRGTIYDDVQQPNGETVEEWFSEDSEGTLLKPDCWDEFSENADRETSCIDLNALELYTTTGGVKKVARYRWIWRPRALHGTANNYTDLFNLVDAANAPASGYSSAMEELADLEHWMRTFAMNDLASYWDAFGNPNAKNTFLYKPTKGTWKLMCWDMDVGLGVFNDPVNDPLFPTLNDTAMNRVYANPAWVRLYWCALSEGVNGFFQTGPGRPIDALLDAKFAAFQASGIALNNPSGIKNWISQRRAFLLTQLGSVSAAFNVTGANSLTTNRNLVSLTGTAPVTVHTILVNGLRYQPTWTSVNAWRLLLPVPAGTTVLEITGLDRSGQVVSNATGTVTVHYTGADELAEENVVINEIMYHPLIPGASYVELFNRSTNYSFDLSGWRLNGVDFTFPPGTIISNRGFLVIGQDRPSFGAAYGWGIPLVGQFEGQLDRGGETLSLIKPGLTPAQDLVVDRVTYDDDPPWPVAADGQGASLQLIDADQDNNRVSNWSDGSGWKFFAYTGSVGSAGLTRLSIFFEVAGGELYLDDLWLGLGNTPATDPNVLVNAGFETGLGPWVVGPLATNSSVSTAVAHSGNGSLHLVINPGAQSLTTFYQDFPALIASTNYTLSCWYLPGGSGTNLNFRLNSVFRPSLNPSATRFTPGAPNATLASLPHYPPLWLSEVEPDNVDSVADNFGDNDPWIEIYNGGVSVLSLDDFYLASTYSNLVQWPFPAGTLINPGQYLLIWADGEPEETAGTNLHTSFQLNPTNGAVILSRSLDGAPQIVDYLNYRNVGRNRSYGSFPSGQSSFRQLFSFPTPGQANNPAAPPVDLFINEWMAANVDFLRDPADQNFDDWFEIYNPTTNRVDLGGFTLTDDLARPEKFTIPDGISVAPHNFLLVWADEQSNETRTNGDLHVNFKLSQDGEQIALYDPAGLQLDVVVFGPQTNNLSQGRWPDGGPPPFYSMSTPTPRAPNVLPSVGPIIRSITIGASNIVTLAWTAQPGETYRVQYKDELNEVRWLDLPDDVDATGTTAMKRDLLSGTQRFYRIQLVR